MKTTKLVVPALYQDGFSPRDEFTPFRAYTNRIGNRNRRWRAKQSKRFTTDSDITVEYLKDLWEKQSGKCPITGWELYTPLSTKGDYDLNRDPLKSGLDRIDNTKGYVKGNVQFVCMMANFARNKFSRENVLTFCRAVVAQNGM